MHAPTNKAARGTALAFAYLPARNVAPDASRAIGTYAEIGDSKKLHKVLRGMEVSLRLPEYAVYAYTLVKDDGTVYWDYTVIGKTYLAPRAASKDNKEGTP